MVKKATVAAEPSPQPATDPQNPACVVPERRQSIAPAWTDERTGAVYVHRDLVEVLPPWEREEHIPPMKACERFGDVESWVAFVQSYSLPDEPPLLCWSTGGLRAVLDYGTQTEPGRCKVLAEQPFERSVQWQAWAKLADGSPKSQRQVLEALEDLAEDIVEPTAAELLGILRTLRATSHATAETQLDPDGGTRVKWSKTTAARSGDDLVLPDAMRIAIPVLRGHVQNGSPVLYGLVVRLRAGVDDSAHLMLRLSIPGAERAVESVLQDRVDVAKSLLGEQYTLLRAAS